MPLLRITGSLDERRTNYGEIGMSKINSRTTMFVTIVLSLAFAATGAGSTFAHEGHARVAPRAAVHRHPGYAGPVIQDDRFASQSDGYDGDRYWSGDNCFPTEPGGCD